MKKSRINRPACDEAGYAKCQKATTRRTAPFDESNKTLKDIAILASVGIATYGLILLTDYVIWDGWWYSHIIKNKSENIYLSRILKEIGRPLDIIYMLPFFFTNNITLLGKVLGVTSWIASSFFQYSFLKKALLLPKETALLIAIISLTCPLFTFVGEMTYNMYIFSVMFFWAAWDLVSTRINNYKLGLKNGLLLRLICVFLFIASFELNSNIAYIYAVAALVAYIRFKELEKQTFSALIKQSFARYWEIIALPIIYWILKIVFTPTCGYYTSYNKIEFSISRFIDGYSIFITRLARFWFDLAVETLVISSAITCLLWLITRKNKNSVTFCLSANKHEQHKLAIGGIFLLLCAPFSYIAVGQPVVSDGWSARNTILVNFPYAIVIVSSLSMLIRHFCTKRPQILIYVIIAIIVSAITASNLTILRWQAFGCKQIAIKTALSSIIAEENKNTTMYQLQNTLPVNVINLRDYYYIPKTILYYPPIIWTYLVAPDDAEPNVFVFDTTHIVPDQITKDELGRESRIVNILKIGESDLRNLKEATQEPYALTKIPLYGRTETVAVLPGQDGNDGVKIGFTYLSKRFFAKQSLAKYCESIVNIKRIN